MRIVAAMLATTAAALALAATARRSHRSASRSRARASRRAASRSTTAIRSTWKNNDKVDHQVVADDGSFASPILHAGQSYTATFNRAGSFRYHDSFDAKHAGRVT